MNLPQPSQTKFQTLRLVLGDQLNARHSWFQQKQSDCLYVLVEAQQEQTYVRHHIQKIVGFFAAMRNFARALQDAGHQVLYLSLDHKWQRDSLTATLDQVLEHYQISAVQLQEPDEYRLDQQLQDWADSIPATVSFCSSEHFLTERDALTHIFKGKKSFLMETFYRQMRRQFDILMDGDKPLTGKWNYDHDNREKLPLDHQVPEPLLFDNDVTEIVALLRAQQVACFGEINERAFLWPINRQQAQDLLQFFLTHCLANFGRYQDALTPADWSLYHSRLSFALNTKMLHPLMVVRQAVAYWEQHQSTITIAQVEGFVRQIIGWREYVRAIYWHHMPAYKTQNFFQFKRQLPAYFWHGQTKLRCVQHAIKQSLEHAYAHHIQRLMVTGNFCLLTEIAPDEVDAWYLGIYIDAIEWVELPNTRGMSQFADGGIMATKPYISGGNYLNKMGHYCQDCHYDVKQTTGPRACPFNSLYWRFIDKHQTQLGNNHRMALVFKNWEKRAPEDKQAIVAHADNLLNKIDEL